MGDTSALDFETHFIDDPVPFSMELMFFSASQTQRIREWRLRGMDGLDKTFPVGHVPGYAVDLVNRRLATLYAVPDNSWAALNLLTLNPSPPQPKKARIPTSARFSACLTQLGKLYGNVRITNVAGTHIFDAFTQTVNVDGREYTIKTDGTRTASDLGYQWESDNGLPHTGTKQSGLTSHFAQLGSVVNNSIAKDVFDGARNGTYDSTGLYALFYHELGNGIALAIFNSKNAKERANMASPFKVTSAVTAQGDRDAGVVFERCLFGGIVNLRDGTVGNTRNF